MDNSKWASVFGRVGLLEKKRDILLNAKCSLPSCKRVSVDRFGLLWEQLTACSVWGYKQPECERSCILSQRERYSEGGRAESWKDVKVGGCGVG